MKRRTFTITIEHDESLFPDEGAVFNMVMNVLHSRRAWFGPNQPGVMTVELTEVES